MYLFRLREEGLIDVYVWEHICRVDTIRNVLIGERMISDRDS